MGSSRCNRWIQEEEELKGCEAAVLASIVGGNMMSRRLDGDAIHDIHTSAAPNFHLQWCDLVLLLICEVHKSMWCDCCWAGYGGKFTSVVVLS